MSSQVQYALMKWITDNDKLSIHHLKHITTPLKSWNEYVVGDQGKAKYPGLQGEWDFVILDVGETRQSLATRLSDLLAERISLESTPFLRGEVHMGEIDETEGHDEAGMSLPKTKKGSKRTLFDSPAVLAKKLKLAENRVTEKARLDTNRVMSAAVTAAETTAPEATAPEAAAAEATAPEAPAPEATAQELTQLKVDVQTLMAQQKATHRLLERLVSDVSGMVKCRQCAKQHYKAMGQLLSPSTSRQLLSPSTSHAMPVEEMPPSLTESIPGSVESEVVAEPETLPTPSGSSLESSTDMTYSLAIQSIISG